MEFVNNIAHHGLVNTLALAIGNIWIVGAILLVVIVIAFVKK